MDALRIIMIIVAALALPAAAMTPEADPDMDGETGLTDDNDVPLAPLPTSASPTPSPATPPPAPRPCETARGESGACAARQACDHGSGHVDHTLYAPSWYTRPCKEGEVCCPHSALTPEAPKTEDDDFDDDFDSNN